LEAWDQRSLEAECKLSIADHSESGLSHERIVSRDAADGGKTLQSEPMIFRAEGHDVLTRWLADFLEPRLMDSHVTVIIPFDNRVILVRPLDGAHFPSRYSEIAQAFDPIPGN
jgi:hypothetical protein